MRKLFSKNKNTKAPKAARPNDLVESAPSSRPDQSILNEVANKTNVSSSDAKDQSNVSMGWEQLDSKDGPGQ